MRNLLDLLSKDGMNVAALRRIYTAFGAMPDFARSTISAMRQLDVELAWRATSLLVECARQRQLGETELQEIAASAEELPHWIARLNLCQLFAITGCPPSTRQTLFPFLVDSFKDRRVIIRAWAISTLCTFRADPAYRDEIAAMLRQARTDPMKAMQARLRQLGVVKRPRTSAPVRKTSRAGNHHP